MPSILRFAIASLFVFVIGAVMIAWGCITAGTGLIGTALLAMVSAVIHREWRKFSLALLSASVFLFLILLIFAKFA